MIPVPAETDNPLAPFFNGELMHAQTEATTPAPPYQGGEQNPPTDDIFSGLKQWQREVLQARLIILSAIDTYRKETGRSLNMAIKAFLTSISNGGPENYKRAVEVANNRKGETRVLSSKTIYKWVKNRKEEGNAGLVPAEKETGIQDIPLWATAFLELYRQPSKPKIPRILEEMGPDAPPYHQVIRFLKKFSTLDILRGRMSGSELRAHKAYTKRDFSELLPMDIIVADGHSFKAYVSHPVHGKRFLPEVETVIDVASRAIVGWSTGLAESALIVADAIRHAVTINDANPMGGQPAIFYADNGAGNRAKMNSHEVTGILSRIGCMVKFGIAGNPQGRGIIERVNSSLWVPAARKLHTYNGHDMDALAQRKRLKIVDKDLKETGVSTHLMSWPQFIDFLAVEVEAYNARPHSSLPKIIDAGGHKRHMTPVERWKVFVAEGWQPDTLNDEEARDLFRPQISCTTRRGLVTIFGNEYFNVELEHHNGETVFVNYDIHDPKTVWVRDSQQRMICDAAWGGNKRAWYPVSVIEQAREKRKNRRLSLKHDQIREIEAEAGGVFDAEISIDDACVIDLNVGASGVRPDTEEGMTIPGECHSPLQADTDEQPRTDMSSDLPSFQTSDLSPNDRPFFPDEVSRYEWHLRNGFHETEDLLFKAEFEQTDNYRFLFESYTQ